MDTMTDDLSRYLYLHNGTQYLVQTSNVGNLELQVPDLQVPELDHPLLTENGSTWTIGGLPILLNGTVIPEGDCIATSLALNCDEEVLCTENNIEDIQSNRLSFEENIAESLPFEITDKGFIPDEGTFITNDLVYKLVEDKSNDRIISNAKSVKESVLRTDLKSILPNNKKITKALPDAVLKLKAKASSESSRSVLKKNVNVGKSSKSSKKGKSKIASRKQNVNKTHESVLITSDGSTLLNDILETTTVSANGLKSYKIWKPIGDSNVRYKEAVMDEEVLWTNLVNQGKQVPESLSLDEISDIITTYKCKKCTYMTHASAEMFTHWESVHSTTLTNEIKSVSLLNSIVPVVNQNCYDVLHSNDRPKLNLNNKKVDSPIIPLTHEIDICDNDLSIENTVYLCCSECSLGFPTTTQLKQHMIADHKLAIKDETSVCTKLSKNENKNSFNDENVASENVDANNVADINLKSLKKAHDISKHARKSRKIKCSIKGCYYKFSRQELLERHEQCHATGEKNYFKCTDCTQVFANWMKCSIHLWRCHQLDVDLVTCPVCNTYKTNNTTTLMHHMKTHGDDKIYKCFECNKCFKQKTQLRNHILRHKKKSMDYDTTSYSKQECDVCKKVYSDAKCLKKHKQAVHSKLKPFICNVCGHTTSQKATLLLHLRQHTGEKPFTCSECKFKTGDHNSLRRHMMRHSGIRKYKCPHCSYAAIQVSAYKYHILKKHPGKGGSYHCLHCPYHTVSQESFFHHIKEHKDDTPDCIVTGSDDSELLYKASSPLKRTDGANDGIFNIQTLPVKESIDAEDDETQNYFLLSDHTEDAVDTGGITIPAGYEATLSV